MKPRSIQAVDSPEAPKGGPGPRRRRFASGAARIALVPAALLALAVLSAACGGGSPSPSSSANSDISKGLSAESAGQTQQAISDFKAASTANPTDPIPYYDLGVIYQQYIKDPTQAASEYNKALLASSSYKPAMYNLAILETSGNPQGAISLYDQLLQANPNDSNVLFNLGLLLHSQGQTAQGQSDISKAVLINPALKNRIPANSGITP